MIPYEAQKGLQRFPFKLLIFLQFLQKMRRCPQRRVLTNTQLRVSLGASRIIRLQVKQTALFQVSVQYITSSGWLLVLTLTHCLGFCLSA